MFLAEIMLRDRMASAAPSSTSALFRIRPGGTREGHLNCYTDFMGSVGSVFMHLVSGNVC